MAGTWSEIEDAATVADYFAMLEFELRGEPYNKAQRNLRLRSMLDNRSKGAVEFKHQNISAVLIEQGFPYIEGYKPRGNYQERLRTEVIARLVRSESLSDAAAAAVKVEVVDTPVPDNISDILEPAPTRRERPTAVYERRVRDPIIRTADSFLEKEARNSSLGAAGELFVLEFERRRLRDAGKRRLAERIEHVSRKIGDGLGYDIASFEPNGTDRLIEVKTTMFGAFTPFFASRREVAVSEERAEHYKLYRLYKFLERPKVFVLHGALGQSCVLDPVQFRATVR